MLWFSTVRSPSGQVRYHESFPRAGEASLEKLGCAGRPSRSKGQGQRPGAAEGG